jgi:hypothetical protein
MYHNNLQVLETHNNHAIIRNGQDIWVGKYVDGEYKYIDGYWHVTNIGVSQAYDAMIQADLAYTLQVTE